MKILPITYDPSINVFSIAVNQARRTTPMAVSPLRDILSVMGVDCL